MEHERASSHTASDLSVNSLTIAWLFLLSRHYVAGEEFVNISLRFLLRLCFAHATFVLSQTYAFPIRTIYKCAIIVRAAQKQQQTTLKTGQHKIIVVCAMLVLPLAKFRKVLQRFCHLPVLENNCVFTTLYIAFAYIDN